MEPSFETTYKRICEFGSWQSDLDLDPDTECYVHEDGSVSFLGDDNCYHTLCDSDDGQWFSFLRGLLLKEKDECENIGIVNLTMHSPTKDQEHDHVFDLSYSDHIKEALVFNELPTKNELKRRADYLARSVPVHFNKALIGGAPYLMSHLEKSLKEHGIKPFYAFSKRESVEKNVNGKIVKTNVFKHIGLIEV